MSQRVALEALADRGWLSPQPKQHLLTLLMTFHDRVGQHDG